MNDQTAIVKANTGTTALAEVEFDQRVLQAAKAIQIMGGRKKDRNGNYGEFLLSDEAAIAAAVYQMGTGQLAGRDFYMNEKVGRMEGYRGAARDAADRGAGEMDIRYRLLTAAECEENEVNPGDVTHACEGYQLRAWRIAQRMGVEYKPIVGIGILREVEKFDKDSVRKWDDSGRRYVPQARERWTMRQLEGGMTFAKIARNRAYKDMMRHVPGAPVGSAEILEEGALLGVEMPPDGARLSPDQAQSWVEGHMRVLSPDEQREAERGAKMLYPERSDDPFGIDNASVPDGLRMQQPATPAAPTNGNGHAPEAEPPLTDAEQMFHEMQSASQERAGTPQKTTPGAMASMDASAAKTFPKWCEGFAELFPTYRKDGKADMVHIMRAVNAEGYPVINATNQAAICKALEARAEAKVAGKEIVGK